MQIFGGSSNFWSISVPSEESLHRNPAAEAAAAVPAVRARAVCRRMLNKIWARSGRSFSAENISSIVKKWSMISAMESCSVSKTMDEMREDDARKN
jgi:hypothetical protein